MIVIIGGDREDHLLHFESVDAADVFHCTDCMPYESGITLWVARRLKVPLEDAWAESKHYD